jgi:hypothetical protein
MFPATYFVFARNIDLAWIALAGGLQTPIEVELAKNTYSLSRVCTVRPGRVLIVGDCGRELALN